jgi:hypothetical protein
MLKVIIVLFADERNYSLDWFVNRFIKNKVVNTQKAIELCQYASKVFLNLNRLNSKAIASLPKDREESAEN